MKKSLFLLPAAALLAACGSGGQAGNTAGQLQIVGSSTVYPFTTTVAEQFQRANPGLNIVVESTGSGAGLKLFCQGIGSNTADLTNSSRRIKDSELANCHQNGVNEVIEFPIGIDGLALIQSANTKPIELTLRDLYAALAARPFGEEQTARTWADVNPQLPNTPIRVLGPPPTSGTRDSLNELLLEVGCASDARMKTLKQENEDQYKDICTRIREDGAFVEAGENDNLLVQKVATDPNAIGVLGYSFLAENRDRVSAVTINGVIPTDETIANLEYPGARRIYIYTKGAHVQAKPAIREFLAMYARLAQPGGPLQRRGLVPFAGEDAERQQRQSTELRPLQASDLN